MRARAALVATALAAAVATLLLNAALEPIERLLTNP